MRRERIRQGRSPAGFASKPLQECSLKNLETLRLEPLKTMKSCPSHCETSATRQSLRKLRRERIRKGRAPAGFCVQAIAELQPQKSRNVAFGIYKNNGIVPQPLRNVSHQAKPKKAASGADKAEPQQVLRPSHCGTATSKISKRSLKTMESCPSHCETSATRQSLRKLRPERIRKGRAPAGFASKPLRNCNLKNLDTLLLEPLKTMKSCPSHCETSAIRQSLRKLRPERIRKGSAPAGFASKPLRNCNFKNLETWNPLKRKKECPNHAKPQPENCRNVVFGTY